MSQANWKRWRGPLVLAAASALAPFVASSCRSAAPTAPKTPAEPGARSRPPSAVGLPGPDIARLCPAPSIRIGILLDGRRVSVGSDAGVVVFGQSPDGAWSGRRAEVARATFVPVTTGDAPRPVARFRVQVGSFVDEVGARAVAARAEETAKLPAVAGRFTDTERYQVRVGEFTTRADAQAKATELHRSGFPGSFVVEDVRASTAGRVRLIETGEEFARATIVPAASGLLAADSASYRGVLEVRATDGGFHVINLLGVEDYLKGVVPNELSPLAFPQLEALKAQAVAARTYAERNRGQFAAQGYDLCATPTCQVYKGQSSESALSSRAVEDTRGIVATYQGEPINALYTSTCGGHTEDGGNVFDEGAPYLKGVVCTPEQTSFATIRTSVPPRALEDDADLTRGAALLLSLGVIEPKVTAAAALRGVPPDPEIRGWMARLLVSLKRKGCAPPVDAALARRGTFLSYLVGSLCWDERATRLLAPGDPAYLLALEDREALSREGERQAAALLLAEGILVPFPDNTLRPAVALTRRQIVVLLARAADKVGIPDLVAAVFQGTSPGGIEVLRGEERLTPALDPAVRLFRSLDGASAAASEISLAVGDDVRYVARDGRVVFLEVEQGRKGVAADRDSRYYRWEVRLTPAAVAEAVSRYGKVGMVRDLETRKLGVSGRVVELAVRGSDGDLLLRGLKVRWGLGLRENLFVIDRERDPRGGVERFVFTGKGWGHGVGLCQVGAFGMAQAGSNFEQILKHYYTGIALEARIERPF